MSTNGYWEHDVNLGPTAYKFAAEAISGKSRETACFGARGDGKTITALAIMVSHAKLHFQAGYPLPVRWIGVRDTYTSHVGNTIGSLQNALWEGTWALINNNHRAVFSHADGIPMVHLDLMGVEDQAAKDRMKTETIGVWFEEPAPTSTFAPSGGLDEDSWMIALTSQRPEGASYKFPAIITSNYPDEDHWLWRRFVIQELPNTKYFRIPPGERASKEQREEWNIILKNRPDLLRRLLMGEPGAVVMGPQVAQGFFEALHVSKDLLEPMVGEPLILGWDFGHTPACIIGQEWRGHVRVYAAMPSVSQGTKQIIQNYVEPWLAKNTPWALKEERYLLHGVDPSGKKGSEGNIDDNALGWIRELLGGYVTDGEVHWDKRYDPMLALLNRSVGGLPALQIDPKEGLPLIQALRGRWYFPQDRVGNVSRDLPKKPNHPWDDLGDAFCYFLGRLSNVAAAKRRPKIVQPMPATPEIGY